MAATPLVVRVDAGRVSGVSFGHLFRCMALVRALSDRRDITPTFLMADYPEGTKVARDNGFAVEIVRKDADETDQILSLAKNALLVIDCIHWQKLDWARLQPLVDAGRVVLIDDKGEAKAQGSLLVNGTVYADSASYEAPLPKERMLLGPEYCILDPAFGRKRRKSLPSFRGRVLVTLGGSDPAGISGPVLWAIQEMPGDFRVSFLVGPGYAEERLAQLPIIIGGGQLEVIRSVKYMADLFSEHDVAVTAGGLTCSEALTFGLPIVIVPSSENEARAAKALAKRGGAIVSNEKDVGNDLAQLIASEDLRKSFFRMGQVLFDGAGADRVADAILASARFPR